MIELRKNCSVKIDNIVA